MNTGLTKSPEQEFKDFIKIRTQYKLKWVSRNNSATQINRDGTVLSRKETTAEHVYSSLKLATYFLLRDEFKSLDREKVTNILLFHDDIEIDTEELSIDDPNRWNKSQNEIVALPGLLARYPDQVARLLQESDSEYRENKTPEAKFCHAIDKMDALIHELDFPEDWWPKWFDEAKVRKLFQKSFEYSPTFTSFLKI